MKKRIALCSPLLVGLLFSCSHEASAPHYPDVANNFSYVFSKDENALAGKGDYAVATSFGEKEKQEFLASLLPSNNARMDFQYHYRLKSPKQSDWLYFKETGHMAVNAAKNAVFGEFGFAIGEKNATKHTIQTLYSLNDEKALYYEWDEKNELLYKGEEEAYRLSFGMEKPSSSEWDFFGKNKEGDVVLSRRDFYPNKEEAVYAQEYCYLYRLSKEGYSLSTYSYYGYDMVFSVLSETYMRIDYSNLTEEAPRTGEEGKEKVGASYFRSRAKQNYSLLPAYDVLGQLKQYFAGDLSAYSSILWSGDFRMVNSIHGMVNGIAGSAPSIPYTAIVNSDGVYRPELAGALLHILSHSLE